MLREIIGKGLAFFCAAAVVWACGTVRGRAEEKLAVLKVGNEVFTNVTVTEVTATDIYFNSAQGMGNAKLKQLSRELQRHFHYNAAEAGKVEKRQVEANAQYHTNLLARKSARLQPDARESSRHPESETNIIAPKLYAHSFLGQHPPHIYVGQMLTARPNLAGKFLLLEFWATWCEPCRRSIPHLNDLAAQFKDRLVILGLSNETAEQVRKMKSPRIDFYVGVDPLERTMKAVGVQALPYAMLIDTHGIVRFEGLPQYLTPLGLERLIAEYSDSD